MNAGVSTMTCMPAASARNVNAKRVARGVVRMAIDERASSSADSQEPNHPAPP